MTFRDILVEEIRSSGPMTVAAFIERALYDPAYGYYSTAAQRSGRNGDFFTSVDVGPLFGELLSRQFAQMWRLLAGAGGLPGGRFEIVEAGAGNGRLSGDVLDAAARDQDFYTAVDLSLVERSTAARAAQHAVLAGHAEALRGSAAELPASVTGLIYANELLDAFPAHALVMRDGGLREQYVQAMDDDLRIVEGPISTARIEAHLQRMGVRLEPGCRADISLQALDWVRAAARALRRGFLVLIDYGHEAAELYSSLHAAGTMVTYRGHHTDGVPGDQSSRGDSALRAVLADPGHRDVTTHVDLTAVRRAAEEEGLDHVATLDQTYFLLGLAGEDLAESSTLKRRLALKTLLIPGGLGSTHKVMIFGRGVGQPELLGCSFGTRLT